MTKKNLTTSDITRLKKMYAKHLPWLVSLSEESAAGNEYKNR